MILKRHFTAAALASLAATSSLAAPTLITDVIDFESATDKILPVYDEDGYEITSTNNRMYPNKLMILEDSARPPNNKALMADYMVSELFHIERADGQLFNFDRFDGKTYYNLLGGIDGSIFSIDAVGYKPDDSTVTHRFSFQSMFFGGTKTFAPNDYANFTDLRKLDLSVSHYNLLVAESQSIDNLYLSHSVTPAVPEPSTLALVGLGLLGVGAAVRRNKKKSEAGLDL